MIAHIASIVLLVTAWLLILAAPFLVEYGWTLMHRLNREVLLNGFIWLVAGLVSSAAGLGLLYVGFLAEPKLFIKALGTEIILEKEDPVGVIFLFGVASLVICTSLSLIRKGGKSAVKGVELMIGLITIGMYVYFMNHNPGWVHFSLW